MQSQHNLHRMMAARRKVMLNMLQQMQGQHNLHKAKKSLHGSGLAITCTIGTQHHTPSLCMANVCIKSGLLTNIAKWNHNGCFTYATTRALCVLQFMVAWLMQLPITTPTSITWAGHCIAILIHWWPQTHGSVVPRFHGHCSPLWQA